MKLTPVVALNVPGKSILPIRVKKVNPLFVIVCTVKTKEQIIFSITWFMKEKAFFDITLERKHPVLI